MVVCWVPFRTKEQLSELVVLASCIDKGLENIHMLQLFLFITDAVGSQFDRNVLLLNGKLDYLLL